MIDLYGLPNGFLGTTTHIVTANHLQYISYWVGKSQVIAEKFAPNELPDITTSHN